MILFKKKETMPENNSTRKSGRKISKPDTDRVKDVGVYLAALRATLSLAIVFAVMFTVLLYVFLGETRIPERMDGSEYYVGAFGAITVALGFVVTVALWLIVAVVSRRYTAAKSANLRNYNLLREELHRLRSRVHHSCPESSRSQKQPTYAIDRTIRNNACGIASQECNEIAEGLEGRGMPWITGLGYIELWHRAHRAEEALIKVEPHTEALGGAMHDESRLQNSNIHNKDLLLKRLRCAVAMLDNSETGEYLNYLAESEKCPLSKAERGTLENRTKALTILSEIRYEINNFRDSVWEGIINARNRLANTSAVLGLATYSLLVLALFMNVPYYAIVWAVVYFLVGALVGLFARSYTEWKTDAAVDDFGLSTARLLHVHWLSGLAAV